MKLFHTTEILWFTADEEKTITSSAVADSRGTSIRDYWETRIKQITKSLRDLQKSDIFIPRGRNLQGRNGKGPKPLGVKSEKGRNLWQPVQLESTLIHLQSSQCNSIREFSNSINELSNAANTPAICKMLELDSSPIQLQLSMWRSIL